MNLKALAGEYERSAEVLAQRIDQLKQLSRQQQNMADVEGRLVLLRAEYYHLLRTAEYLTSYYEDKPVVKAAV